MYPLISSGILNGGIDVDNFIKVGVVSGLRQLLEFGLFHGDPHPGNIFALRDGRIAYVDFGNVAQLSNTNKQVGGRGFVEGRARGGGLVRGRGSKRLGLMGGTP
jgi:hypothetical protein